MKELLIKLRGCSEAREWAGDKTIEEIVEQCHRGDWLLWLAAKIDIGLQPLTLAKGHCANTVRHLMKDERSIKAVDTAIAFGEGKATREELDKAAYVAADAAWVAVYDAAADAAWVAADKKENHLPNFLFSVNSGTKMKTADICRKYIGQLIIDKCNELKTK